MINELDLKSLWWELDQYSKELDKETESLQEVWVKIAQIKARNDTEMNDMLKNEEFSFIPPETFMGINVGGQIFETTCDVLIRDPYSILAALCREKQIPSLAPDERGIYYFDRDWWLFRHILAFLRSNTLPNELETLKELYTEASYYRLESLQRAIENIPLENISNLSPQINVTWPGVMDGGPNPLRRPHNASVLDGSLYKGLR